MPQLSAKEFLGDAPKQDTTPATSGDMSAADFLSGAQPAEPQPAGRGRRGGARGETTLQQAASKVAEFGTGFNDFVLDALNIPNDAFNWAAEKLDSDKRIGDLRSTVGRPLKISTVRGDEPDSGTYRAGKFTSMGLSFLAPFLGWIKGAQTAANIPGAVAQGGDVLAATGQTGMAKGISQTVARPFMENPTLATTGEVLSNIAAGYGSYVGEETGGAVGEQVGGLVGGMAPAAALSSPSRVYRYVLKSTLPMTEAGARIKAREIIEQALELPEAEVMRQVQKNADDALEGTKFTFAQLAEDMHLLALQKAIVEQDPKLAYQLQQMDLKNNLIASNYLKGMRGVEGVEEAQKFFNSKYLQLSSRLNARVDMAMRNTQDAIADMAPKQQRAAVNTLARAQLDGALRAARKSENELWKAVDKGVTADFSITKGKFKEVIDSMDKFADRQLIPDFIYGALGRPNKKGKITGGKLKAGKATVGNLQTLRSRLLSEMREEKSKTAPNWNRVRIMDDMEEAILNDLKNSPMSDNLEEALNFSRSLNQKFKGDIMNVILGHEKTGGSLAPDLTLNRLGGDPDAKFYHIRRLLDASPEMHPNIEEVLKAEIATSAVVKADTGTLNLRAAKDYMRRHAHTMDLFPKLREQMDNAIGLQEKTEWLNAQAKARYKKAKGSTSWKVAINKPGSVLNNITTAQNPAMEMKRTMRLLNDKGKRGIKNAIFDRVIKEASTGELGMDNRPILSGANATAYWQENKQIFKHAFADDPAALKRMEVIMKNLRWTDEIRNLPIDQAREIHKGKQETIMGGLLEYAARVYAAKVGAGAGRGGASLQTAAMASERMKRMFAFFSIDKVHKVLRDSVLDKELFETLTMEVTDVVRSEHHMKRFHSWMLASMVESMDNVEYSIGEYMQESPYFRQNTPQQ